MPAPCTWGDGGDGGDACGIPCPFREGQSDLPSHRAQQTRAASLSPQQTPAAPTPLIASPIHTGRAPWPGGLLLISQRGLRAPTLGWVSGTHTWPRATWDCDLSPRLVWGAAGFAAERRLWVEARGAGTEHMGSTASSCCASTAQPT